MAASPTVFAANGKEGAGLPTRYVGATKSGAPTYGAFETGDFVIDRTGVIWMCTAAGIPGTWTSPLPTAGGTMTGDLTTSAHIQANGAAPAVTAGTSAGSGAPAPAVGSGSNDIAAHITFGTGTGSSTGQIVNVTYSTAWSTPGGGPVHVVVNPMNDVTQALGIYAGGLTNTGFNLHATSAPADGQANTVYSFSWIAIG